MTDLMLRANQRITLLESSLPLLRKEIENVESELRRLHDFISTGHDLESWKPTKPHPDQSADEGAQPGDTSHAPPPIAAARDPGERAAPNSQSEQSSDHSHSPDGSERNEMPSTEKEQLADAVLSELGFEAAPTGSAPKDKVSTPATYKPRTKAELVKEAVETHPDWTVKDIATNTGVSEGSVYAHLSNLGLKAAKAKRAAPKTKTPDKVEEKPVTDEGKSSSIKKPRAPRYALRDPKSGEFVHYLLQRAPDGALEMATSDKDRWIDSMAMVNIERARHPELRSMDVVEV